MKKSNSGKSSFRRQLISGAIYAALAVVISAVTINTTVGMLTAKDKIEIPDAPSDNISVEIPSLPEISELVLPEIDTQTLPDDASSLQTSPVSETPSGVDSTVTEPILLTEQVNEETDVFGIPADADLGIDRFVKPCDGYVQKEHSAEIPVYSATMADYRVHVGVDVTGEPGAPVCAVIGGIVSDVYNDDLYGKTVCITSRGGYTVKYSNLLPTLNGNIEKGALIKTGDVLGGIGDTALCEAVDPSHVHIEIYDSDGLAIDPENLISF